ncbi:FecR family protein [Pedobacter miscanthi]|uniref:FecR family protein n=1 Tax=Pedobacter miscanthi TaxID=2259170 RepID=UPI00292EB997|nr:FecR domain-containing protein [Pedobacter miscanthi]
MAENPFHIAELITAYLQDSLSAEQRTALDKWLEVDANRLFLTGFSKKDELRDKLSRFGNIDADATWKKTLTGLAKLNSSPTEKETKVPVVINIINYKWIAGLAAVLIVSIGIYFFNSLHNSSPSSGSVNLIVNDIAPGRKGATLTMADGRTIELDGKKSEVITSNSEIIYSDGTAIKTTQQDKNQNPSNGTQMLTASTANGRSYIFTLPDGTRVWLNAASTIKFPMHFTGNSRTVEISGEAYLEVYKDRDHPFVVRSKDQQLEVLGTHFNIRSYAEESRTKTTLLEGSVKIAPLSGQFSSHSTSSPGSQTAVVLKPNEQSVLKQGKINIFPADTDMETAWIRNDFQFRGETMENVLKDVARWYDVKIIYQSNDERSTPLIGQISRDRPLSAVLERIASASHSRFKIEGKLVTVMPYN